MGKRQFAVADPSVVVARTPLLPLSSILAIFESDDPASALRAFLAVTPLARQAILIASPSLAAAMDDWIAGREVRNKNLATKLLAYVVRMASRGTPFGICAGLGTVDLGPETTLRLDVEGRATVTRPDMSVVAAFAQAVEAGPGRANVRFVANDAVAEAGGRLFVTNVKLLDQRHAAPDQRAVTLKNTAAVAYVRERCRQPRPYAGIVDALSDTFGVDRIEAARTVDALVEAGLLVSELALRPVGDPIATFLATNAHIDPQANVRVEAIVSATRAYDRTPLGQRSRQAYEGIVGLVATLSDTSSDHAVQIDMRSPTAGTLSASLVDEAALMAEYFLRMGPVMALDAYRDRFVARYEGRERLVPLLELVDENLGIGSPALEPRPAKDSNQRNALLCSLAFDALASGAREVELGAGDLNTIAPPLEPSEVPRSMEIGFRIASRSLAALSQGEYLIGTTALHGSTRAARSVGRFAHLLDDDAVARVRSVANAAARPDERYADLVFPPSSPRLYNVSIRPRFHDLEIAIGVPPSDDVPSLSLNDLWVGLDGNRFFLWSKSLRRRIVPVENHLMNTSMNAPNICRFLACVARDGERTLQGFNWGLAWTSPRLPRVRVGRIVLSAARWRIPASRITASPDAARATLAAWRASWALPRFVQLEQGDNCLLVDLDSPIAASIIYDQATGRSDAFVELAETFPSPDDLWLEASDGRYVCEFVASVVSHSNRAPATPRRVPIVEEPRPTWKPGSAWVYAKFYLPPQAMDDFLVRDFGPFVDRAKRSLGVDRWFFVRYSDTSHHVRIRMRSPERASELIEATIDAAKAWVDGKTLRSYSFDTYDPEYERYGGVDQIDTVEDFFTADSERCLAALRGLKHSNDVRVAKAVELAMPWFADEPQLRQSALRAFETPAKQRLQQSDRETLRSLADGAEGPAQLAILRSALLADEGGNILRSLFHMHCNRLGVSGIAEVRATVLLRAVIVARNARAAGTQGSPKNAHQPGSHTSADVSNASAIPADPVSA